MHDRDTAPMDRMSAHIDRAWDLVSRGDLAGAMVSALKSLELDPEAPEVHNLVGYIHAQEGRADDAMESYERAIELDESFVEAMLNAAEVLVFPLGDHDRAIEFIDGALEWVEGDEEQADATLLKVDALLAKGDLEGARQVAAGLPQEPLENISITLGIGRARFDVGEHEAAAPFLERAAAAEPGNGDANYYLGLLQAERGNLREASVSFLRAREIDVLTPVSSAGLSPRAFEERVRVAMGSLPPAIASVVQGALVIVSDLPGAEVVAEGVDPRTPVFLDDLGGEGEPPRAGRVFFYRRNVERATAIDTLDEFLVQMVSDEVTFAFAPSKETPG